MRSLLPFRRQRSQNARQKSRGQSLVEFALVLPVFLIFLAAALDLGRVFYANISLNNAAREGAFEASKHPAAFGSGKTCDASDAGRIVCRVQHESRLSAISVADGDITATCSSACNAQSGSTVTVKVKGAFQLATPILSAIFGGQTVDLNSAATAQIEYFPGSAPATAPPPPNADFETAGSRSCSCSSLTVDFLDTSTGSPSAWQWNFGDGSTSTEQFPSHAFGAGDWTVSLTAINSTDASTRTKNNYIQIHVAATPTPTPAPGATPTPTPAPTPEACIQPPDVIGLSPSSAAAAFSAKGSWKSFTSSDSLTTGPKNKIQAQNPDAAGPCKIPSQTNVILYWRKP